VSMGPSAIHESGHFYFAQTGHSHFAPTGQRGRSCTASVEMEAGMQWIYLALGVLAGFWGSFFGAYFKKKGENKAIQEDIAELTKTTKEIEAKISSDVWDRQKRWELKRDVLFVAAKRIAEIDEALVALHSTLQVEQKPDDLAFVQSVYERVKKWSDASAAFDEAKLLVAIACDKETKQAVEN